jgi:phosphatidylglycerophosphatase A
VLLIERQVTEVVQFNLVLGVAKDCGFGFSDVLKPMIIRKEMAETLLWLGELS